MSKKVLLAVGALLGLAGPALGAGFFTNGVPPAGGTQYPGTVPLTGNETIPADTNLTNGQNPASEAITTKQLRQYVYQSSGGTTMRNMLIGGDPQNNLWQRGTSVGSITTTLAYTADRLFAWSGTSTTMSVAQTTAAADLQAGYTMGFKVARTGAGVVQTCVGQVVESSTAVQAAGSMVEFFLRANSGAGFSSTNAQLSLAVIGGTGTDEGAAKMAFGYNAGGGGASAWTGQSTLATGTVGIGQSKAGKYALVASVPAGTTELGVVACWTPVGGSPSNDYVSLMGLQLSINNALSTYVGTAGVASVDTWSYVAGTTQVIPASANERRPIALEAGLQQRYYYRVTETNGAYIAPGMVSATNVERATMSLPVLMRTTPTCVFVAGGLKWDLAGTDTAVGTLTCPTGQNAKQLTIGDTVTATVGSTAFLFGSATTGSISVDAELN